MKMRSMLSALGKLVRAWGATCRCALTRPRELARLCQELLDAEAQMRVPNVLHCSVEEFLAAQLAVEGAVSVRVGLAPDPGARGITLAEGLVLCSLVCALRARQVFEIGTYRGWTSYLLASAMPRAGKVFTLELRPGGSTAYPVQRRDRYGLSEQDVGQAFRQRLPASGEVVQLWGDSACFDFSPWERAIDLVFIDGAHTYPYVRNDTFAALGMVRDGGLVVWHDLKHNCPAVARVLARIGRSCQLYHIEGTSLVVHRTTQARRFGP